MKPDPNCPHCKGTGQIPASITVCPCKYLNNIASWATNETATPLQDIRAVQRKIYGSSPLEHAYRQLAWYKELEKQIRQMTH